MCAGTTRKRQNQNQNAKPRIPKLKSQRAHLDNATSQQLASPCSAGFQPAVSRISNPQALRTPEGLPTGSRRYSRLETCATVAAINTNIHQSITPFLEHPLQPEVKRLPLARFTVHKQFVTVIVSGIDTEL